MNQSPLPSTWEVPQEFRDRLGEQVGRQRAMLAEGHLLLVLHAPPKVDEETRRGRFFWRKPDGSWSSNELGDGIGSLMKHLNEYAEMLEKFDRMEEAATTADDYFAVVEPLAPLQRAARNMHATLQDARKMIPSDRNLINMRDRAYELERTAELLYQGAKNSLDFAVARRAEEQARSSRRMEAASHRLNLLAAFFFPLATLSAVFGINVRHGLEDNPPPWSFLAIMCIGIALGFVIALVINRTKEK